MALSAARNAAALGIQSPVYPGKAYPAVKYPIVQECCPLPAVALAFEPPCVEELRGNRSQQKAIETFAEAGRRSVPLSDGMTMMPVHVCDAEMRIAHAEQHQEAEPTFPARAAVDQLMGGQHAKHARADADGNRQTGESCDRAWGAGGHPCRPDCHRQLQRNVEHRQQARGAGIHTGRLAPTADLLHREEHQKK
jgi:hypothetical protein